MRKKRFLTRTATTTLASALLVSLGSTAAAQSDPAAIQQELGRYRSASGSVGASATVRDGDAVQGYGSGSIQVFPQAGLDEDTRFRAGSQTKMFVAAIILQLVDEKKVDLDESVEEYLPGVVRGKGIDASKITVRHLLQHRSGIKDNLGFAGGDLLQTAVLVLNPAWQIKPPTEQQLVNEGTKAGKQAEPGAKGQYSNTNYVLLGMLISKITGNDLTTEFKTRIIDPLGLKSTFFPRPGEKHLPAPSARGYLSSYGLPFADFTNFEPAVWGAAGGVVSTGRDLTLFVNALLGGRVLSKDRLADMKTTLPVDKVGDYGLGLVKFKTDCKEVWGHSGQIAGYTTITIGDGERSLFSGVNNTPLLADGNGQNVALRNMVNDAICH
ncbi:serine hydrolase domain-containing protein [Streptomyces anulatus]